MGADHRKLGRRQRGVRMRRGAVGPSATGSMSSVTEDQVASDRDLHAVRLSRAGWTYSRISEYLGYPDRRAAHRGVLRGLAEPAAEEAMLRAWRVNEIDDRLGEVQRHLWDLMERHQPYTGETAGDARAFFRIIDALFAVLVRRCQLRGLFTHPYRYDTWWRRDVPFDVWTHLHLQANRLEREARIPVRYRGIQTCAVCGAGVCRAAAPGCDPAGRRRLARAGQRS
jgi:hypothetical protein